MAYVELMIPGQMSLIAVANALAKRLSHQCQEARGQDPLYARQEEEIEDEAHSVVHEKVHLQPS